MSAFYERVYEAARRIPFGRVATYGDLARVAGSPRAARGAGWAMRALPEDSDVPWWRVVNREGVISCRAHGTERQEEMLRAEGIPIIDGGVDLARYRWEE
jgi:methylated-DNA-protein-cysteine methyltransferase-like protein